MRGEPITVDAVRAVTEIVADAETGSVLVFCASGQRAAAWWAARMIEGDGVGLERALERARRAGVSHAPTIAALKARAGEVEARKEVDRLAEGLTGTLMQRLGSAIEGGGIEHAARVCARSASTITAELGARQGVVVRRTSLRWRNPENQPTADERPWLIAAEAALDAGRAIEPLYEVVREKDGSAVLRHLRPIVFPGGLCSQCHGSKGEIPAEVRTFLAERYPDDRAINFTPGELRGAIRVTVPLE